MSFLTRVYMHPDVEAVQGENTLAAWDARWPEWVDDLLEAGKLTQSRSDNFPSLYRGLASDILPMLPPDRGRTRRASSSQKCTGNESTPARLMPSWASRFGIRADRVKSVARPLADYLVCPAPGAGFPGCATADPVCVRVGVPG